MKRRLLITAVVVLVLSLAAYGTVAYLTGRAVAHNIITAGNVDIDLIDQTRTEAESTSPEASDEVEPFPPGGIKVLPGTVASKEVAVENVGDNPCWVRIKLEKTVTPADGVNPQELNVDNHVILNFEEQDDWDDKWLEKDGYYYYLTPLTPGRQTPYLFTLVTFDKLMGNEYQNSTVNIIVTAEAIQSANNDSGGAVGAWNN